MRAYHLAAFLALFVWQATPVRVVPDSSGRYRLSVAAGSGRWEDASFDCEGELVDAVAVPARSAGVRFDYFLGDGLSRLTVVGGRTRTDDPFAARGTFVGGLFALEAQNAGVALGAQNRGRALGKSEIRPMFYARIGDLDRAHFRVEVLPASETPSIAGDLRMGIGFGQGRRRQVGGFLGAAWGPYTDRLGQWVLLADIGIPLFRSLDVLVRGSAGPCVGKFQWAAGGGLRAVW